MMSNPKEIDKSIATDTIIAEINSSRNDEQIDSISFTSEELQNTIRIEGESSNSTNESYGSNIIEESEYKPDVSTEFVPVVNSVFKSLNLAVKMYTDYAEMAEFVVRASKAKIGPTMAHKIRAVLKRGYEYVRAKVTDYKNLRRGVNRILCYKDAQIMKNKMNDRRDHYPNYSFEFLGDGDLLVAMFWEDEREKAFYAEFGEVISFDATFRTHKYKMVSVPLTTVDHHKKSITVGVGLLSRETIESYKWMLIDFLRAHERKAPKNVLTDQDAEIKQAMESVLPNSRHRLCMWHIMKKLQAKVTGDLFKNKDFKKRFNKLVWNMHLKPDEFEKKWDLIINEFNLEDKDGSTICLNYVTNGYLHTSVTQESIQKQRNTQHELDHQTKKAVEIKLPTNDVKCTCEHFNHFRTLCRHAFNILMKHGIKEIHEQYIKNRWRKDVISRHYNFGRHVYDIGDNEINKYVNQAYYNFEACLEYVRKNKEKMDLFVKKIESMLKEYENDPTNELQKNRTDVEEVGKLMGISIPKDIDINVPNVQSNKGCGKKSRIQSAAEIAYENSNKQTRRCSGCGETAPHNLRRCPIKLAAKQSSKAT
ncbi:uncharacterized protein LOC111898248 [Lactuca sativa]|uniref:uncharacterized protein LOC111898248 n=1 Tax=Lactuca sativa TaxID=4236 RepID=UPI0022B07E46|nr:uncharacterized protein LOC111898248 [Lactuca sativa]